MPGFIVPVAEILGHPGSFRDITIREVMTGVSNALVSLTDEPVEARLKAEAVVEGILASGRVTGSTRAECARCLKPIPGIDLDLEVCELFLAEGHEVPEDEETYEIHGLEIDVEPMLRDALALALPLKPLCKADCLGLCASCGKDLNDGPCDCVEEETDPRWAALSELRDRLA